MLSSFSGLCLILASIVWLNLKISFCITFIYIIINYQIQINLLKYSFVFVVLTYIFQLHFLVLLPLLFPLANFFLWLWKCLFFQLVLVIAILLYYLRKLLNMSCFSSRNYSVRFLLNTNLFTEYDNNFFCVKG